MPFSFAIFLANGDANILPSFTTVAEAVAAGAETGADCVAGADDALETVEGAAVAFGASTVAALEGALIDFTILSISKPGCPIIHNN